MRRRENCIIAFSAALFCLLACLPSSVQAADFSSRDIAVALAKAKPGEKLNYSDADLSLLDLAGLDLTAMVLTGADLYGADLKGADLTGVDLSDARLDRAVVIDTNFARANLTGSTLILLATTQDMSGSRQHVARFEGAIMCGARVLARLEGADFSGADLTETDFSALEPGTATIASVPKSYLSGANFSGALLRETNMSHAVLDFAKFVGADLSGANFRDADVRGADFSGANLEGSDFSGAMISGAVFDRVEGAALSKGLSLPQ